MPAPPATVNRLATIAADINLQAGKTMIYAQRNTGASLLSVV